MMSVFKFLITWLVFEILKDKKRDTSHQLYWIFKKPMTSQQGKSLLKQAISKQAWFWQAVELDEIDKFVATC